MPAGPRVAAKPRIFYGTIAWRSLDVPHVASLMRLMTDPQGAGRLTISPQVGDAMVDRARGMLATRFLQSDYDVLMSVDSDIVFNAADVFTVCDQAAEYGIVAGAYVKRDDERAPIPASHFELGQTVVLGGADPTPVPVRWPAGGFVAVHRRVFEGVIKHHALPLCNEGERGAFYPLYTPFWIPHENHAAHYLSEDWAFFERAREAGFPAYLNPAVKLQHYGVYRFGFPDMLRTPLPDVPLETTRAADGYHVRALANQVE